MSNVTENFTTPMRASFVVPPSLDSMAFTADMAEALGEYSDYQLIEAARWLKQNRTHRSFPTIAECRQACVRFAAVPSARQVTHFPTEEEKKSEAIRQRLREQDAVKICRGAPLAESAHEQGWLSALIEFVEDRGVLPSEPEASRVRAKSMAIDANLRALKPEFVPDATGQELDEFKRSNAIYKAMVECRLAMKQRAWRRLWGEPSPDPVADRRRAIAQRFADFQREHGAA